MAYFLGKEIGGNMDDLFPDIGVSKGGCLERCREQLSLDPGFDYQGCVDGCGGMRVQPGETTPGEVSIGPEPPFRPVTEPGTAFGAPVTEPGIEAPVEEGAGENWIDKLIAGMFGKDFETIRGIGGRTREATFDVLARQGLMGTGAAKGVGEDIAWQTERGISDLMRWSEMWKYQQEQEAMNQMLQYFFGMGGMWR